MSISSSKESKLYSATPSLPKWRRKNCGASEKPKQEFFSILSVETDSSVCTYKSVDLSTGFSTVRFTGIQFMALQLHTAFR